MPQTDIWKTEYDRYNLAVTYLLDLKKVPLNQLLARPHALSTLESEILFSVPAQEPQK